MPRSAHSRWKCIQSQSIDLLYDFVWRIVVLRPTILRTVLLFLGDWMQCTTTLTFYLGLQSISAYGLVGVAVTRFVSIRDPLTYRRIITRPRVVNVLIVTWIGLFLLSAALYFRTKPYSEYPQYEAHRASALLFSALQQLLKVISASMW